MRRLNQLNATYFNSMRVRGCLHDNGATFIPGWDEKLHRVYIKPCLLGCESCSAVKLIKLRAQLYGLGYPRQPSPRATLAEVTFSLFLSKIQPAVYIRIANSSRGARQLGWASCLTSAGRVTLASGTTFLHINALARLTGTSLGVANVT